MRKFADAMLTVSAACMLHLCVNLSKLISARLIADVQRHSSQLKNRFTLSPTFYRAPMQCVRMSAGAVVLAMCLHVQPDHAA